MRSVPLGEIFTLEYGKPLESEFRKSDGAYQAYGANGPISSANKFLIEGPCVIVGRKGSAGEITYVEDSVWPLDVTYYIKHNSKQTDLRYLFYVLKNLNIKQFVRGVKPGLNRNDVYDLPIQVPSLETQREIVKKLDTAFEAIDALEENLENSDKRVSQLLTSVLSWSFKNSSFQSRIFSEKPGNIPMKTSTLGEVMDFQNGRAFKTSEWRSSGIPIIRIQNLNNFNSSYNYFDGIYDDRILINEGDLLFSWSGTVGTSFGPHIWKGSDALLNQHIYKVTVKPNIEKKYAYYALQSITSLIEDSVNGSVGLTHITKAKLINFEIPLPSLNQQKEMVEKLDSTFAEIAFLKDQIAVRRSFATSLRQSLLSSALAEMEEVA
jgi:type I restriction enzyme S subunit